MLANFLRLAGMKVRGAGMTRLARAPVNPATSAQPRDRARRVRRHPRRPRVRRRDRPLPADLSERGETSIEIAEAAAALRERLLPITAPPGAIDVCGTGGDGHHTLNVSTAVALVVAAVRRARRQARQPRRLVERRAPPTRWRRSASTWTRAGAAAEETLHALGICFLFRRQPSPRDEADHSRSGSGSAGVRSST